MIFSHEGILAILDGFLDSFQSRLTCDFVLNIGRDSVTSYFEQLENFFDGCITRSKLQHGRLAPQPFLSILDVKRYDPSMMLGNILNRVEASGHEMSYVEIDA